MCTPFNLLMVLCGLIKHWKVNLRIIGSTEHTSTLQQPTYSVYNILPIKSTWNQKWLYLHSSNQFLDKIKTSPTFGSLELCHIMHMKLVINTISCWLWVEKIVLGLYYSNKIKYLWGTNSSHSSLVTHCSWTFIKS